MWSMRTLFPKERNLINVFIAKLRAYVRTATAEGYSLEKNALCAKVREYAPPATEAAESLWISRRLTQAEERRLVLRAAHQAVLRRGDLLRETSASCRIYALPAAVRCNATTATVSGIASPARARAAHTPVPTVTAPNGRPARPAAAAKNAKNASAPENVRPAAENRGRRNNCLYVCRYCRGTDVIIATAKA